MMPNFMIIGAPRAGTTSIYHYLRQHPEIAMSRIKETNFFAYLAAQTPGSPIRPVAPWAIRSVADYQAQFKPERAQVAVGEVSPYYFYTPGVPEKIKAHLPDIRLIAILREPVSRAYSGHVKNVREGYESRPFARAIEDELQGQQTIVHSTTSYLRAGMYFRELSRFLTCFDRSQLQVYLFDDLVKSPRAFMQTLYAALGVDPDFVPDTSVQFNRGYVPMIKGAQHQRLKKFTVGARELLPRTLYFSILRFQDGVRKNLMRAPGMPPALRIQLRDYFADDIGKLQALIGRDLSHWLEVEAPRSGRD